MGLRLADGVAADQRYGLLLLFLWYAAAGMERRSGNSKQEGHTLKCSLGQRSADCYAAFRGTFRQLESATILLDLSAFLHCHSVQSASSPTMSTLTTSPTFCFLHPFLATIYGVHFRSLRANIVADQSTKAVVCIT